MEGFAEAHEKARKVFFWTLIALSTLAGGAIGAGLILWATH